jgi:hypothetical protein
MVAIKGGSLPSDERSAPTEQRGAVTVWATVGLVWTVVVAQARVRWIGSDTEFAPAPVHGPGFCAAAIVCIYHLPLSWFNMMGDSIADLPSAMLPG